MSHVEVVRLFRADSINSSDAMRKLESLRNLSSGWHFGAGHPPSETSYNLAVRTIVLLRALDSRAIEVFPIEDGGILVSAKREDNSIDIACEADGVLSVVVEQNDEEILVEEGLSWEEMLTLLRQIGWKGKSESGLFTLYTTATQRVDSKVQQSGLGASQYRLWMNHVQSASVDRSASISPKITGLRLQEAHQSSLGSKKPIYQRIQSNETKKVPETSATSIFSGFPRRKTDELLSA